MDARIETRVRYVFKRDDSASPTEFTHKGDGWIGSDQDGAAAYPWLMEHTIAWVETRVVAETPWEVGEESSPVTQWRPLSVDRSEKLIIRPEQSFDEWKEVNADWWRRYIEALSWQLGVPANLLDKTHQSKEEKLESVRDRFEAFLEAHDHLRNRMSKHFVDHMRTCSDLTYVNGVFQCNDMSWDTIEWRRAISKEAPSGTETASGGSPPGAP